MKITKILAGLLALMLSFLSIALVVGPFMPSPQNDDMSTLNHAWYFIAGLVAFASAMWLWVWASQPTTEQKDS
jgi:surface polysaccharide O-acyltransferase-like enzyme